MFGHWFEILVVLLVGLLVFGPKRVIEMGSQLGKLVRELRESTRDINFSSLLSTDEPAKPTTYSYTPTPTPGTGAAPAGATAPTTSEHVVEGALEPSDDIAN